MIENLVISLFSGIVSGWLVWIMTARRHDKKRAGLIRMLLTTRYRQFRLKVCEIMLKADSTSQNKRPEDLLDADAFYQYYTAEGERHWYGAINGLHADKKLYLAMQSAFSCFRAALLDAMAESFIEDEKLYQGLVWFVDRLEQFCNDIEHGCDMEDVCTFLLGFMGKWSTMKGSVEKDWVHEFICSIR